jgi:hypothetical protein
MNRVVLALGADGNAHVTVTAGEKTWSDISSRFKAPQQI